MIKLSITFIFEASLQILSILSSRSPGINVNKEGKLFFALMTGLRCIMLDPVVTKSV